MIKTDCTAQSASMLDSVVVHNTSKMSCRTNVLERKRLLISQKVDVGLDEWFLPSVDSSNAFQLLYCIDIVQRL